MSGECKTWHRTTDKARNKWNKVELNNFYTSLKFKSLNLPSYKSKYKTTGVFFNQQNFITGIFQF